MDKPLLKTVDQKVFAKLLPAIERAASAIKKAAAARRPILLRYNGDADGVSAGLAIMRALEKLGAYNKRIPMDATPTTSSLYIVAPLSSGEIFSSLFSTHPPLERRIEALRNMGVTR